MPLQIDPLRWQRACDLAAGWVEAGKAPAITFITGTANSITGPVSFGSRIIDEVAPLSEAPIYLVASITKPIVVMGAMLLVERGQLSLCDRVTEYIPEFGKQGKYGVEVRHLMTHTSGLPDMLPNNNELRASHATLQDFVQQTCDIGLDFPPGRGVQYQSMGLLILSEIMARITGQSCAAFLQKEIFEPRGMQDSVLGIPSAWYEHTPSPLSRCVDVRLTPEQQQAATWNWNSRYWRQLGAPWGGLFTSAQDLAKLSQCLLRGGKRDDGQPLFAPATVAAATRNQIEPMRDIAESDRRCKPWGLGWRLHWPTHSANFGDLLGPNTYGHWGATGTVMWIDPDHGTFAVILSSQPQEPTGHFLSRLSNSIAAAWV
ncbi:serine hydrolase [bacterium]|nr:serine hydrolase [bacterium]